MSVGNNTLPHIVTNKHGAETIMCQDLDEYRLTNVKMCVRQYPTYNLQSELLICHKSTLPS